MATDPQRDHSTKTSDERIVAAMRESAARLNGIIQSAMDAIITVDEHQDIVIFNPAAEQMFGCAGGRRAGHAARAVHPAALSRERTRAHIDASARPGSPRAGWEGNRRSSGCAPNGDEFPVEASISQVSVGRKEAVHA